MRADAVRNRAKIIDVARSVFQEHGLDASLDDIARRAGVGPGTLYRHFPTREDLLDAIMATWVQRVGDRAAEVIAEHADPRARLLAWFESYVGLLSIHRGTAARVTADIAPDASPAKRVYLEAMSEVLSSVHDDAALTPDITPLSVCRLLGGVAAVVDAADLGRDELLRLLGAVLDGVLAAPAPR